MGGRPCIGGIAGGRGFGHQEREHAPSQTSGDRSFQEGSRIAEIIDDQAGDEAARRRTEPLHPTEPIPTGIANGRCGGMNTSSSDQGGTPAVAFDNGPLQASAVASQDCPGAAVRGTHRSPVLRATMGVAGGKCVARTPWISIGTPSLSSSTETRAKSSACAHRCHGDRFSGDPRAYGRATPRELH